MRAFSHQGHPIVATADLIPGNALLENFIRAADGGIEINWAGGTDICWDGQITTRTEPDAAALLEALKNLWAFTTKLVERFGENGNAQLTDQEHTEWQDAAGATNAAVTQAEAPHEDIYVDEAGNEWPESQVLFEDQMMTLEEIKKGDRLICLVPMMGDVDGEGEVKHPAGMEVIVDTVEKLSDPQGWAVTVYTDHGVVNVFDEADFEGLYPFKRKT